MQRAVPRAEAARVGDEDRAGASPAPPTAWTPNRPSPPRRPPRRGSRDTGWARPRPSGTGGAERPRSASARASVAAAPVRRLVLASTLPAKPATRAPMAAATAGSMPVAAHRARPPAARRAVRGMRGERAAHSARAAASAAGETRCVAPRIGRTFGASGGGASWRPSTSRSKRRRPKAGRMQCTVRAPRAAPARATPAPSAGRRRPPGAARAGGSRVARRRRQAAQRRPRPGQRRGGAPLQRHRAERRAEPLRDPERLRRGARARVRQHPDRRAPRRSSWTAPRRAVTRGRPTPPGGTQPWPPLNTPPTGTATPR